MCDDYEVAILFQEIKTGMCQKLSTEFPFTPRGVMEHSLDILLKNIYLLKLCKFSAQLLCFKGDYALYTYRFLDK